MARKRHTAEEIVAKLQQVDVLVAQGRQVSDAETCHLEPSSSSTRWLSECLRIFIG